MTLLGAGAGFSIGSNVTGGDQSNMNMSLDDMIASRRKDNVRESRRAGGRNRASTADRSIATGRAKRAAAVNARRQLTTTKKPTKMEIEKEVKTQVARTQNAKARQAKAGGGRVAAATTTRRQRAAAKAANVKAPAPNQRRNKKMQEVKTKTATVQTPQDVQGPTRKAVNAAMQAFRANGFNVPQGTQVVIRLEQKDNNAASPKQPNTPKGRNNNNNQNNNNRNNNAGGRGNNNRNNNNNNNRNNNNNNNNARTRNNNNNNNNNNNAGNNRRRRGGRGNNRN